MLYLIKSFGENNQSILKLGFSDNLEKRLGMYFYHNPFYKTLSTREGDDFLESLFHIYLKGLGFQFKLNGSLEEWYVDSPEVLEIFELTQEELEKKIWETREECFGESNFKLKNKDKGYKVLKYLYSKFGEGDNSFVTNEFEVKGIGEAVKVEIKEVDKFFWEVYKEEVISREEIIPDKYSEEDKKITQDFLDNHFYQTGIFQDKMKMYCEFMDTHRGNREIEDIIYHKIKDQKYRSYYNFYGTKGCSARRFVEKSLREGMMNASKDDELQRAIYTYFKTGQRYTKTAIKEGLGIIYRDLDITSKKPKTSDLSRYFSLTRTRISNKETGKLDEGFRLESLI